MQLYDVEKKYKLFPAVEEAGKSPDEWKVIEFEISSAVIEQGYGVEAASLQMSHLFKDREGSIFVDSDTTLVMVVQAEGDVHKCGLLEEMKSVFSRGSYTVSVKLKDELYELPKITVSVKRPSNILHIMTERGVKRPSIQVRKERADNVILVIEDDTMMRKMAVKAMSEYPAHFEECVDGVSALEAYYEQNPDVVFLDIHMPGKTGHSVLKEILKVDPQAYVVMLSGDSAKEQVLAAVKSGAKGFVAKPFTKDKLLEYIMQCPSIKMPA